MSMWASAMPGLCPLPSVVLLVHHSLVDQLKSASCGIECAGEIISGLLFADNTALLVSDESGIKKSLEVLAQWCKDCMGG